MSVTYPDIYAYIIFFIFVLYSSVLVLNKPLSFYPSIYMVIGMSTLRLLILFPSQN